MVPKSHRQFQTSIVRLCRSSVHLPGHWLDRFDRWLKKVSWTIEHSHFARLRRRYGSLPVGVSRPSNVLSDDDLDDHLEEYWELDWEVRSDELLERAERGDLTYREIYPKGRDEELGVRPMGLQLFEESRLRANPLSCRTTRE